MDLIFVIINVTEMILRIFALGYIFKLGLFLEDKLIFKTIGIN
jgi:hypothetical protein